LRFWRARGLDLAGVLLVDFSGSRLAFSFAAPAWFIRLETPFGRLSLVFTSPRGWPTFSDEFLVVGERGLIRIRDTSDRRTTTSHRPALLLPRFLSRRFVSSIPRARAVYWFSFSRISAPHWRFWELDCCRNIREGLEKSKGYGLQRLPNFELTLFFLAQSPHTPPLDDATISTESQAFFFGFWHLLRWYTRTGRKPGLLFWSASLLRGCTDKRN